MNILNTKKIFFFTIFLTSSLGFSITPITPTNFAVDKNMNILVTMIGNIEATAQAEINLIRRSQERNGIRTNSNLTISPEIQKLVTQTEEFVSHWNYDSPDMSDTARLVRKQNLIASMNRYITDRELLGYLNAMDRKKISQFESTMKTVIAGLKTDASKLGSQGKSIVGAIPGLIKESTLNN